MRPGRTALASPAHAGVNAAGSVELAPAQAGGGPARLVVGAPAYGGGGPARSVGTTPTHSGGGPAGGVAANFLTLSRAVLRVLARRCTRQPGDATKVPMPARSPGDDKAQAEQPTA
jgi:hypothetical protein